MYLNGVLLASGTTVPIANSGLGINLGFLLGSYTSLSSFSGSIKDILIDDEAYTAGEVASLYATHQVPAGKTPLAFYRCEEESGTTGYNSISNANHLTLTNITQATFHAADTGVKYSHCNEKGYTLSGSVVIPASLSNPTLDAAGNALGVTGPVLKPATVDVPCVTGDGSAVYVDLGSALIPATADFNLSFWYYHAANSALTGILCQGANASGRFFLMTNTSPTANSLLLYTPDAVQSISISGALTLNAWNYVQCSRSGSTFVIACTDASGIVRSASSTSDSTAVSAANSLALTRVLAAGRNAGCISDLRITTGGVTKYFWLAEGDSRHVYWIGSDGTGGKITNAIVNGTVATIRGQRCPYVQSPCILYGGGIGADSEFVPGRIGSNLDAAGNAKTISAGEQSPYDVIYPNRWNMPSLVNVGITSSTAWGKTTSVQATSPADTKFRNTTKGTKNVVVRSALTGVDLTNLQNYVST